MSDENRADRLRRRRQRARDKAQTDESEETDRTEETNETGESGKAAKPDEAAKRGETAKPDDDTETAGDDGTDGSDEPHLSVKDEQKPTYMYLPHAVRRDLDRAYSMLKAEYEYEYQEGFEKNRHFYPLVVSLGLEAVDELDPEDVRDRLEDDR